MVDRVRPLKLEDAAAGGTQTDPYPTSMNPNEDYLDARGVALQNASSNDSSVRVERIDDSLVLEDPLAGQVVLSAIAASFPQAQYATIVRADDVVTQVLVYDGPLQAVLRYRASIVYSNEDVSSITEEFWGVDGTPTRTLTTSVVRNSDGDAVNVSTVEALP